MVRSTAMAKDEAPKKSAAKKAVAKKTATASKSPPSRPKASHVAPKRPSAPKRSAAKGAEAPRSVESLAPPSEPAPFSDEAPTQPLPALFAVGDHDPEVRERIAQVAYFRWLGRDGQGGNAVDDWLDAEREVLGAMTRRSFH
jgi:hypothetical protein